ELAEILADQSVLAARCPPREYATLLSRVAEERLARPLPPFAVGLFGTRAHLEGRIRMILASNPAARRRPSKMFACLAAAAALFIGIFVLSYPLVGLAQERRAPEPPTAAAPQPPQLETPRVAPPSDGERKRSAEFRIAELEEELERVQLEIEEKEIARLRSEYERDRVRGEGDATEDPYRRAELEAELAKMRANHLRAKIERERERAFQSRLEREELESIAAEEKALQYGDRNRSYEEAVKALELMKQMKPLEELHALAESALGGDADLRALVQALAEQVRDLAGKVEELAGRDGTGAQVVEIDGNKVASGNAYIVDDKGKSLLVTKGFDPEGRDGSVIVVRKRDQERITELEAALAAERAERKELEEEVGGLRRALEESRREMDELRKAKSGPR
ncbi:MAG: hypothetical protein L0Z55_00460, partial [Planctomycetes bacterium]|nr:hypothetical protein [Planctomycetota bacterium]